MNLLAGRHRATSSREKSRRSTRATTTAAATKTKTKTTTKPTLIGTRLVVSSAALIVLAQLLLPPLPSLSGSSPRLALDGQHRWWARAPVNENNIRSHEEASIGYGTGQLDYSTGTIGDGYDDDDDDYGTWTGVADGEQEQQLSGDTEIDAEGHLRPITDDDEDSGWLGRALLANDEPNSRFGRQNLITIWKCIKGFVRLIVFGNPQLFKRFNCCDVKIPLTHIYPFRALVMCTSDVPIPGREPWWQTTRAPVTLRPLPTEPPPPPPPTVPAGTTPRTVTVVVYRCTSTEPPPMTPRPEATSSTRTPTLTTTTVEPPTTTTTSTTTTTTTTATPIGTTRVPPPPTTTPTTLAPPPTSTSSPTTTTTTTRAPTASTTPATASTLAPTQRPTPLITTPRPTSAATTTASTGTTPAPVPTVVPPTTPGTITTGPPAPTTPNSRPTRTTYTPEPPFRRRSSDDGPKSRRPRKRRRSRGRKGKEQNETKSED